MKNNYINISKRSGVRKYHKTEQPRFRWTPELHQYFVQTVESLGGKHKATPKHVLNMMQVKGLRISHIKSHLQMYRNMKRQTVHASILEENAQFINDLKFCFTSSPQKSRNIKQEIQPSDNKGISQTSETDRYYDLNQEPESSACLLSDMSNEEGNYETTTRYLNLPFPFSSLLIPLVHNDHGQTYFSSPNLTHDHVVDSSSTKSHGFDNINLDLSI